MVLMAKIMPRRFVFVDAWETVCRFEKIVVIPIITDTTNLSAYSIADTVDLDSGALDLSPIYVPSSVRLIPMFSSVCSEG